MGGSPRTSLNSRAFLFFFLRTPVSSSARSSPLPPYGIFETPVIFSRIHSARMNDDQPRRPPMSSPAKRRGSSAPYRGKTLLHFFGRKSASKVTPSVPQVDDAPRALWGGEDHNGGATTATGDGSTAAAAAAAAGSKRRRSSSQEKQDFQLAERVTASEAPSSCAEGSTSKRTKHHPPLPPPPSPPGKDELPPIQVELDSVPLDSDPLSFNPDDYKSLADNWPDGKATYGLLTRAFVLVNATRSRIRIVDTLVNVLRILIRLDPSSLLPAVCRYSLSAFLC